MNSPLGQYAQAIASIVVVAVIAAFLVSIVAGNQDAASSLNGPFWAALGAVLGSSVAVNGWKQPVSSIGSKADVQGAQIQALGTIMADIHPPSAPAVAAILTPASAGDTPAAPPATSAG